jgi:putative glutamine amidotransferase
VRPRIAIPVPHSDREYAGRSLPQYEYAITMAGGEPVRIPLNGRSEEAVNLIEGCDAVLLPGSKADVDPAKYHVPLDPHTNPADSPRDVADELLLQHAYRTQKPIFGICYGLQILNVHRRGTLLQHIDSPINHEAGRKVPVAHEVAIEADSKLAAIVGTGVGALGPEESSIVIPVNSSHHQSADAAGDGLRVVAHCPNDGIIEALEGTSPDHFVLAVQWHPERSVDEDERSRALFRALVRAAEAAHGR